MSLGSDDIGMISIMIGILLGVIAIQLLFIINAIWVIYHVIENGRSFSFIDAVFVILAILIALTWVRGKSD